MSSSSPSEKDQSAEKADKPSQSTNKKEPLGKISMFTVPMKITPIKPAGKVHAAPKRISLSPAPSKPGVVNPTAARSPYQATAGPVQTTQPVASTAGLQPSGPKRVTLMPAQGQINANSAASQVKPRRVPLIPVASSQSDKSSDENKPTAQVTPRRISLTPVGSASKSADSVTGIKEVNLVSDHVPNPPKMDSSSTNGDPPSVDARTRETNLVRTSSPPQTTPSSASRRIQLTTLASDPDKGCTKEVTQVTQPLGTSLTSDHKSVVNENGTSTCTEPTAKQSPLVREGKTGATVDSKPRRIALTPVQTATQTPSTTSLTDKENNKINQPPQPRRVMLTTLTPLGALGGENTQVEQQRNSSKKYQAPRRPIPLEPEVIVLDN